MSNPPKATFDLFARRQELQTAYAAGEFGPGDPQAGELKQILRELGRIASGERGLFEELERRREWSGERDDSD
jgi:predicted Ser/Thr protein kinase